MKHVIRILYKMYPRIFHDLIVEDFYGYIPKKISNQAVYVLNEKRAKVDQWLLYQVHMLRTRIPKHDVANQTTYGMLLQIRLLMLMLGNSAGASEDAKPKSSDADARKMAEEELESALDGVENFRQRKAPEKEEKKEFRNDK